jgi:hypothetical protein
MASSITFEWATTAVNARTIWASPSSAAAVVILASGMCGPGAWIGAYGALTGIMDGGDSQELSAISAFVLGGECNRSAG